MIRCEPTHWQTPEMQPIASHRLEPTNTPLNTQDGHLQYVVTYCWIVRLILTSQRLTGEDGGHHFALLPALAVDTQIVYLDQPIRIRITEEVMHISFLKQAASWVSGNRQDAGTFADLG